MEDIERDQFGGGFDAQTASDDDIHDYVLAKIQFYTQYDAKDNTLWMAFKEEFETFQESDFKRLKLVIRANLRQYLIKRGVFVQHHTNNYTISKALVHTLLEEVQHEWTDDELSAACIEVGPLITSNLRHRLSPDHNSLARSRSPIRNPILSPISSPTPSTSSPIPPLIPPPIPLQILVQNPNQIPVQNLNQILVQNSLQTYAQSVVQDPLDAILQILQAQTFGSTTPPATTIPSNTLTSLGTGPSALPSGLPSILPSGPPSGFARASPIPPPPLPPPLPPIQPVLYSKESATVTKMYTDDQKYSGTSDSFDYKLTIFYDICRRSGVPSEGYMTAFSAMLKGIALSHYYDSNLTTRDFSSICTHLRNYFEGPEYY